MTTIRKAQLPQAVYASGLVLRSHVGGASTGRVWYDGVGSHLNHSPVDGSEIGTTAWASEAEYAEVVRVAHEAFKVWRLVPAPRRGEVIRLIGEALRQHKEALATLITFEMGKSIEEGRGEVQEMIDMADYAVGLGRQIHGRNMVSERPAHRMYEQYHPLGIVGIISAFNFPMAVWSWNSLVAWVCGNVCVWKPSEKTPLTAVACQKIVAEVFEKAGMPEGISCLVLGDATIGKRMAKDKAIALVSATGSVRMGRHVAQHVAERLGRSLLELGGNNALIISDKANLDIAIPAAVFGAIGTCGQRCTSTRRLFVHETIYDTLCERLQKAYGSLRIGSPLEAHHHVGPLIDESAVEHYLSACARAVKEGGRVLVEGGKIKHGNAKTYVKPTVMAMPPEAPILQEETFAPLLYVLKYQTLSQAIAWQNSVSQGLSSALMTEALIEAERFLSVEGSDCGIANINIGTSGAEIGGAFGGEKDTGGGREAGSDSWKAYMRRQTNTINFGDKIPLAQGIQFNL